MKVHYINILLFAHALNILVNTHKKTSITQKIQTNRSLCECELYSPANYDSDPQMKKVMENFNKQTEERFREYDERMQSKRMQCKEQCDKEIQKIILKDKLEKELMDKFATLDTDIQNDSIPTCVCERSMADKTEKFCLNCGKTMGGVAYGWGLVGSLMYTGWTNYVATTVAKAAMDAGMEVVRFALDNLGIQKIPAEILKGISSIKDFRNVAQFADIIQTQFEAACKAAASPSSPSMCKFLQSGQPKVFTPKEVVEKALGTIVDKAPGTAEAAEVAEAAKFVPKTTILTNTIIASIFAIEVIVLIMVIIYWILRYRRKKKMKKKLQYIKLLEE
ncbi:rifin PIR protein,putative [Plasmodium sp. DRC-Itaito]|nr:rifin PIR protein,putative [Plasmodium sp. DRC-Itaito]